MAFKITVDGVDETIADLERAFGVQSMAKMIDKALLAGAGVIKSELEKSFDTFKDTGASKGEITVSDPMTLNGERTVVIYWEGKKNRWAILHLNEFGTIHNPQPRGKGAIERAMRAGQDKYFRTIEDEIARAISR